MRALLVASLACIAAGGALLATSSNSVAGSAWTFATIAHSPLDTGHSATDPEARYMYTISEGSPDNETGMATTSGMTYQDLKAILDAQHKASPSDLVGYYFESPENSGTEAVGRLILDSKSAGGKYKAPAPEAIRQAAIDSLAKFKCPNFDGVDPKTAVDAIRADLGGDTTDLSLKIRKASLDGQAHLEDASDAKDFPIKATGLLDTVLYVKNDTLQMPIVLKPTIPPVICGKVTAKHIEDGSAGQTKSASAN